MRVVTAGYPYLDIDAYGGMIAYAELLNLQGVEAIAATTAPLNESITPTVRSWRAPLVADYKPADGDDYALIDISEPAFFDKFVRQDRVAEVIDHHPGLEAHWHERIGDAAVIDFIGAACTLVYEQWVRAGLLEQMSVTSARLLVCGILDNTLNFGARVTTDRDRQAYDALLRQANLPDDWPAQYFAECQQTILKDPQAALKVDTKRIDFKTFERRLCVGQMVVWDGKTALADHQVLLGKTMADMSPDWFINIISVGDGHNYFYTDNTEVQIWLADLFGVTFDGSTAMTDRLWLRKEIIKQDLERAEQALPKAPVA
jgi:inorganic pyrophosphatase/exopolyphosphatase